MPFARDFSLFLFDNNIIRFEDHVLASGKTASCYIDLRLLLGFPRWYKRVIDIMAREIASRSDRGQPQGLVGVPTGGLAVAASVAYAMGRPLAYVRKEAKAHGTGKRVEGGLVPGASVFVIEDVVTTGGSAIEAFGPVRGAGASVDAVFTIIDRQGGGEARLSREGVEYHSLISLVAIIWCLQAEGRITRETAARVNADIRGEAA